jgi:hypothetical protein
MDGSMDAEWKAHPKGKSGSDLMLRCVLIMMKRIHHRQVVRGREETRRMRAQPKTHGAPTASTGSLNYTTSNTTPKETKSSVE